MTYELGPVLDFYSVAFDPDRSGNQQVTCPFHEDRSPSASVHLDKGVFNCFTCGVGVNAVQFIMRMEGLSFGESKRKYEELAGKASRPVQRQSDRRGSYLPRRSRDKSRGSGFVSPWARKRA